MHGAGPVPHKELEVKLELAPENLHALHNNPLLHDLDGDTPKRRSEISVYFDTKKHKLHKNGLLLRVRRVGNRYIQTIKAEGQSTPFERDEWETEIAGAQPDLDLAEGTALEPLVTEKLRRRLKPLFETRVQRTIYRIDGGRYAIELTVDRGTIDTGSRSAPLCEIELELERGSPPDLFDLARELTQTVPARLAVKSKSERAYEIIDKTDGLPAKAIPNDLAAAASTREAFKIIALACIKQIIDNYGAVVRGDPEGVHQMRVGLRRLRAAMSLFSVLLHDTQTTTIKAELKWLTEELGSARELDVLVERVVAPMKRRRRWRGMPSLSQEIAGRRDVALKRAQDAVQSTRLRALTLDLAAWLEIGKWTNPEDDLIRDRGDMPITVYVVEELRRRWRKLRKKGKRLADLDAHGRHKLRIQTKKLRYAAEFFAALFAKKRAVKRRSRFVSALERLQDALGDLNDIAVHEKRIVAMSDKRRRSNPSRAFAAGLLTGREDARVDAAIVAAKQGYVDLAKVKPFWR